MIILWHEIYEKFLPVTNCNAIWQLEYYCSFFIIYVLYLLCITGCIPIHHIEELDQFWAQVALDKASSILDKKLHSLCNAALLITCRLQRLAASLPPSLISHIIIVSADVMTRLFIRHLSSESSAQLSSKRKQKEDIFLHCLLITFCGRFICWFSAPTGNLSVSDVRSYCLFFNRIDLIQLKVNLVLVLKCAFRPCDLGLIQFPQRERREH